MPNSKISKTEFWFGVVSRLWRKGFRTTTAVVGLARPGKWATGASLGAEPDIELCCMQLMSAEDPYPHQAYRNSGTIQR